MSAQHEPARTPLPPESPRVGKLKGRRDKAPRPRVSDYTLGAAFVAERREHNGFVTHLECVIVDVYEDDILTDFDNHGVCLYAKVRAVSERKHAYLVGHLVKVSLAATGSSYYMFGRSVRLTRLRREDIAWIA